MRITIYLTKVITTVRKRGKERSEAIVVNVAMPTKGESVCVKRYEAVSVKRPSLLKKSFVELNK